MTPEQIAQHHYEVVPEALTDAWRAECILPDGACYVVIFSGPDAEIRARAYAAIQTHDEKGAV